MMKGYMLQLDLLTAEGGEGLDPGAVLRGNLVSQLNEHTEVPHVVGEVALRFGFIEPRERPTFEDFIGNIYGNAGDALKTFKPDEDDLARVTPLALGIAQLREAEFDFHNGMYDPLMSRAQIFSYWLGHTADNVVDLTIVPDAAEETETAAAEAQTATLSAAS